MKQTKVIAILLAGGSGSRFGADRPKQFLEVNGCTVLEHSIRAFHGSPLIDEIVVITRADFVDEVKQIASAYPKVKHVRPGGKERYHSTLSALEVCTDADDLLLIHDAVRPLVSEAIISRCIHALEEYEAIGVAMPSTDTIVRVDENDCIVETLPRVVLRNMQTPQGFRQRVLRQAFDLGLADPNFAPTDDCGVVRTYLPHIPIKIVEGEATNIKITYPKDLEMIKA
ncbi:MAG: 2-C-methyl-D-erythritol 4-phosphate cytidylyltransferase [Bacteroidaceae bacterium]|nr:2-C-methyl-D-erythritol 4-phosphate cytidylyltransferase [Bacteroidaceae bacterium]